MVSSVDAHDRFNQAFMSELIYYQQYKQIVPRMAKTHRLYFVETRYLGHNPNCHKPVTCDFFQQLNNPTAQQIFDFPIQQIIFPIRILFV